MSLSQNQAFRLILEGEDSDRATLLRHRDPIIRAKAIQKIRTPTLNQLIEASKDHVAEVRFAVAIHLISGKHEFPLNDLLLWLERETDPLIYKELLSNPRLPGYYNPGQVLDTLKDPDLTTEQLNAAFSFYKERYETSSDSTTNWKYRSIYGLIVQHPASTEAMHLKFSTLKHQDKNPHVWNCMAKHHNISASTACLILKAEYKLGAYEPDPIDTLIKNPEIKKSTWDAIFSMHVPRYECIKYLRREERLSINGVTNGLNHLRNGGACSGYRTELILELIATLSNDELNELSRQNILALNDPLFITSNKQETLGNLLIQSNPNAYQKILSTELHKKISKIDIEPPVVKLTIPSWHM
ncbi:hypothetical protein [Aeromonas veronii]|uniref:Uncharacterized protein n=1 Tax=Aeromonas veronii TaxID=654 RepID=A0A4S5CCS2_AERVE|nr:hypothetical protein [Aeromonas veronii]THJ43594.1 hypothetical protein E8Q35_14910 [Aeromonas veronii]